MAALKKRIERVYRAQTGSRNNRGAVLWFAGLARVNPYSVKRWISGERQFRGAALALLETLETQYFPADGRNKR